MGKTAPTQLDTTHRDLLLCGQLKAPQLDGPVKGRTEKQMREIHLLGGSPMTACGSHWSTMTIILHSNPRLSESVNRWQSIWPNTGGYSKTRRLTFRGADIGRRRTPHCPPQTCSPHFAGSSGSWRPLAVGPGSAVPSSPKGGRGWRRMNKTEREEEFSWTDTSR